MQAAQKAQFECKLELAQTTLLTTTLSIVQGGQPRGVEIFAKAAVDVHVDQVAPNELLQSIMLGFDSTGAYLLSYRTQNTQSQQLHLQVRSNL